MVTRGTKWKKHAQWEGTAKGHEWAVLGELGQQEVVVSRVWGIRKLELLVVSLCAATLFGGAFGWPASGAIETSLDECRRSGGHESGKYCSGGALNGAVIREFSIAEVDRYVPGTLGKGLHKAVCKKWRAKSGNAKRYSARRCGRSG
jgi:hypothetical protein